jgi:hypothetical protein
MKKLSIAILVLVIILLLSSVLFFNKSFTGNTIKTDEKDYMYTKAICNSSNFCQDHEITCQGNKTVSIKPITGAVIQNPRDWEDPRAKEDRERMC